MGQRWFVPRGRSHNLALPRPLLFEKHLLSRRPPPLAIRDPPPSAQSLSRPQINLLRSLGNTWPTSAARGWRNRRRSAEVHVAGRVPGNPVKAQDVCRWSLCCNHEEQILDIKFQTTVQFSPLYAPVPPQSNCYQANSLASVHQLFFKKCCLKKLIRPAAPQIPTLPPNSFLIEHIKCSTRPRAHTR